MKYQCPSCRANWNIPEKHFRGGTPFTCDDCKKTSTIPLYCPECSPIGIETKGFLETPSGYLGGERFRCPRGHTFTVPVMHAETLSRLGDMGARIGTYSQSPRIDSLADVSLKKQVSGGMCAGVVFDWIRRALQGGKTTYADVSPRQDRRAAIAWTESSAAKRNAFFERELEEVNAARRASFQDKAQQLDNLATKVRSELLEDLKKRVEELGKRHGITQAMYDELVKLAKASYELKVEHLDAKVAGGFSLLTAKVDADAKAKLDRPAMERFWKEFSTKMDRVLEQDRMARGKTGSSARGFSNLVVAKSIGPTEYATGIVGLFEALIRDAAFKPNFAAYVAIRPPREGATGHAVGVMRRNTGDRYVFFDPNYGTYEFSAAKLREAVTFLFRAAYPHALAAPGSDNHVYEINGRVNGEYTIFENSGASAPTVAPHLPVGAAAAAAGPRQLAPRTDGQGR